MLCAMGSVAGSGAGGTQPHYAPPQGRVWLRRAGLGNGGSRISTSREDRGRWQSSAAWGSSLAAAGRHVPGKGRVCRVSSGSRAAGWAQCSVRRLHALGRPPLALKVACGEEVGRDAHSCEILCTPAQWAKSAEAEPTCMQQGGYSSPKTTDCAGDLAAQGWPNSAQPTRPSINQNQKNSTKGPVTERSSPVIWSDTDHTMAWPGGVRARRGIRPFHSAGMPAEGEQSFVFGQA